MEKEEGEGEEEEEEAEKKRESEQPVNSVVTLKEEICAFPMLSSGAKA